MKPLSLAVAVAVGMMAGSGFAQQGEEKKDATQKLGRIEVTGSNIKRVDTESTSVVQVISAEEIARSGATNLFDVLKNIPANQSNSSFMGDGNSFTQGASSASLRGLGASATLVLVNGRRVAPYGFAGFQTLVQDINSIPKDAIERVEILKDGASAIYGSDAIAGVVNFILRRDYVGLQTSATAGRSSEGDAANHGVSVLAGYGDLAKDRFNVMGTYSFHHQDRLLRSEREWMDTYDLRRYGGTLRSTSYIFPGNFDDLTTFRFLGFNGSCPSGVTAASGRCLDDSAKYQTFIPESDRHAWFGRGVWDATNNLSLFGEGQFVRAEYHYQMSPQFYTNDANNFYLIRYANDPDNPFGRTVGLRYAAGDIGPRRHDLASDALRLLAGAKGSFKEWDWEVAFGYNRNEQTNKQSGLIMKAPMEEALRNHTYIPGRQNSPEVLARISPTLQRKGQSTNKTFDAKLSGEIFQLPAGPVQLAAGLEHRRENLEDKSDDAYYTGAVFGWTANATKGSRNVTSVFAEANVPLLKSLEAQLALRSDKYSDYGRSTTPKVGVKWTPLKNLAFRANYAEGFRAPSIRELAPEKSRGFNTISDPRRCLTGTETDCQLNISVLSGGNPNLKPEEAKSFTYGMIFEPVQNFSIGLDFYRIKRTNEISALDMSYLLANQDTYASFITRDSTGRITGLELPYYNLGQTIVKGVDWDVKLKLPLQDWGKVNVSWEASYMSSYKTIPLPGQSEAEYIGTYGQPRFRSTVNLGWERADIAAGIRMNYTGRYSYQYTPYEACDLPATAKQYCDIRPWTSLDLWATYTGVKNLKLSMSVNNIQNKRPPIDMHAQALYPQGYNAAFHDGLGRYFQITGSYKFK